MPLPLSLTGKRWSVPATTGLPPSALPARLLVQRRLAENVAFSPRMFPDMEHAVLRVRRALANRETVAVFGDYDCDGITATALLTRFFRRRGIEPIVRLPHRITDGYGLHAGIVEECAQRGVTLLITVDTGITAVAEVKAAAARGIDVIVTDHHHVQDEVPQALALLHPLLAPGFPLPHPSGAGVALAFVRALEEDNEWEDRATDLSLAAIGTIADLVELRGGNRSLVQQGLVALNSLSTGPLALLAASLRTPGRPLTSADIAFRLAPRINAAGRMQDPGIALTALLEGGEALKELERLNSSRQGATEELMAQVWRQIGLPPSPAAQDLAALPPLLALASEQFAPGLIGLIAGRLTEATGRPSLVVAIRDGTCTGSLRSTDAYHVTEGLERMADCFETFGGHARAAGCTFPQAHLDAVTARLTQDIRERTTPDTLLPALTVDALLAPQDLTLSFVECLAHLEPFGQGNEEPLFLLPAIRLDAPRRVGAGGAHLQARVAGIKAIGWRLGHLADHASQSLDVVCTVGIDTWNGRRSPQIVIEDMRLAQQSGTLYAEVAATAVNARATDSRSP